MLARGATNRQIAVELGLSPRTVKQYAHAAYWKLGARNRAGAVLRAQRLGLII
jgi:DNA-binding NarL/FixJ family response regulator